MSTCVARLKFRLTTHKQQIYSYIKFRVKVSKKNRNSKKILYEYEHHP